MHNKAAKILLTVKKSNQIHLLCVFSSYRYDFIQHYSRTLTHETAKQKRVKYTHTTTHTHIFSTRLLTNTDAVTHFERKTAARQNRDEKMCKKMY